MAKPDILLNRLEVLKQATLSKYLEAINLDSILGFYDNMIDHVFHGDLDDQFLSKSLLGLDSEEKAEIFQLARKYKGLCFYGGNQDYWADSIDGVTLSDADLVCMKLLDNYDFLLGLAKDGGDQALKFLGTFQPNMNTASGSTIDFLRHVFPNDDILRDMLLEMSKEDGKYKGFTNRQKEILCTYPSGVLFDQVEGQVKILSPKEISKRIQEMAFGEESDEIPNVEALSRLFTDDDDFESTVIDIYYDQMEKSGNYVMY